MVSLSKMNSSTMLTTYASFAASVMLARSITNELLPPPLLSYLISAFRFLLRRSSDLTIVIHEDSGMSRNQVYEDAELYLSTKISPSTGRIGVSKTVRQKKFQITVEKDQDIADHHRGVRVTWRLVSPPSEKDSYRREKQFFELTFDAKSKEIVMESYLPYVMERAAVIREGDKVVKLYSRNCPGDDEYDSRGWGSVILEHPSTFNTLAMDPDLKKSILDDLDRFVQRRDFYRRVGKAWKRGYLLYGPPGTGKSSLIAAMANYLKFDVYDLELTSIYDNSNLREVLLATTNRSILVVEDIDCNREAHDRGNHDFDDEPDYDKPKMTLSGLLNFIDGLWSSCGDERIIVFTTNRKEKLDHALLRPGRMDVHINMPYCTFQSFKILVSNYLGISITNHPLCDEIERTMESTKVTPAEVAEELMRNDNADIVLNGLVNFLNHKEVENTSGHGNEHENKNENGSGSESESESKVDEGEKEVHVKKKSKSGRKGRKGRGRASM